VIQSVDSSLGSMGVEQVLKPVFQRRTFVDYLDFVRRPANGFVSTHLPLRGGTELSVKT